MLEDEFMRDAARPDDCLCVLRARMGRQTRPVECAGRDFSAVFVTADHNLLRR